MKNILIVEDERRLARFMELELTHEGYQVDIVSDGQSALMNLMNKNYDVMLLDLMIPIVDGIEVRSIQLYSFVAVLFFIICFIGSRISLHYEGKSRKAKVL